MRPFVLLALVSFVSGEQELFCGIDSFTETHFTGNKTVSSCKDCEPSLCKSSDKLPLTWMIQERICYWSDYREQ